MGGVLHRTTLDRRDSVSNMAARFPIEEWVHYPDYSNVDGVAKQYWVTPVVDPGPVEMDDAAKLVKDAEVLAAANADTREQVLASIDPQSALEDRDWSISVSGLTISFTLDQLIDDDHAVTADSTDTKFVEASLINDTDAAEASSLVMLVRTRTTALYADRLSNETLVTWLGEWSVVANGDTLVEVT